MGPMGCVAVIAGSDEVYDQISQYESVVGAHRPLKIFRDAEMAYAWLNVGLPLCWTTVPAAFLSTNFAGIVWPSLNLLSASPV